MSSIISSIFGSWVLTSTKNSRTGAREIAQRVSVHALHDGSLGLILQHYTVPEHSMVQKLRIEQKGKEDERKEEKKLWVSSDNSSRHS